MPELSRDEIDAYEDSVRAEMSRPKVTRKEPVDLRSLSFPQKRMILQSHVGHRARIRTEGVMRDLEIVACGADLSGNPDKITMLIGRAVSEDNRWVTVKIQLVDEIQRVEWDLTDPRHPEYEHPGRVVRPAAKQTRKGRLP